MDVLPTLPVAETAPQSTEALPAIADPPRGLRLRCANRAAVCPVPDRLENLLPPDHLARQVWEMVKGLDLSEFYADIHVAEGTRARPRRIP